VLWAGVALLLSLAAVAQSPSTNQQARQQADQQADQQARRAADMVLLNGRLWTADAARSWASALVIREGRLVYVGDDSGARAFLGPQTELVDLAGKMVLPGFCDSHTHPVISGIELGQLQLGQANNRQEIEQAISAYASQHPELEWVVGGGWNLPAWPAPGPTRQQLDALIPDRPAFLTTSDAHTAWVNSKALQLCGVDQNTPNPPGGRIERDAQGFPSGLLREEAIALVAAQLPTESERSYREGAQRALRLAASFGITTWHEANANEAILRTYRALEDDGQLTARVVAALQTDPAAGVEQLPRLLEWRNRWSSPLLQPRAAKIFVDGVLESRTAALLQPYTGFPYERGILSWQPEALQATVLALDAAGFQLHAHAIGDRAIRQMLDAIENARKINGARDARHHMAHIQLIDPQDLPRFRRLGVLANVQPLWAHRDDFISQLTEPVLGPQRSAHMYPLHALHASGAVLVAGSDWSVSSMNPLEGIEVAWIFPPYWPPTPSTAPTCPLPRGRPGRLRWGSGLTWWCLSAICSSWSLKRLERSGCSRPCWPDGRFTGRKPHKTVARAQRRRSTATRTGAA
jgi:predicted amidohydrolase YtcJ